MAERNIKEERVNNELSLRSNEEEGELGNAASQLKEVSSHDLPVFTFGTILPDIAAEVKHCERETGVRDEHSLMDSPQTSPFLDSENIVSSKRRLESSGRGKSTAEEANASRPSIHQDPNSQDELESVAHGARAHQTNDSPSPCNAAPEEACQELPPTSEVDPTFRMPGAPLANTLPALPSSIAARPSSSTCSTRSPSQATASSSPPISSSPEARTFSPHDSPHSGKKRKEHLYYLYVNRFNLIDTAEDRHQWSSRAKQQWGGGDHRSGNGVAVRISSNSVVRGRVPFKPLQFNPVWSGVTWGQDSGIQIPLHEDAFLVVEVVTPSSSFSAGGSSRERGSSASERVLAVSIANAQAILEEERQWGKFCLHLLPIDDPLDFLAVHGVVELTMVVGNAVEEKRKEASNLAHERPDVLQDPSRDHAPNPPSTPAAENRDLSTAPPTLATEDTEKTRGTETEVPTNTLLGSTSEVPCSHRMNPAEQRHSPSLNRATLPVSPVTPASMVFAFTSSSAGNRGGGDVGFTTLEYNYGAVRVSTVDFFYPPFYLSGRGQYIVSNVLCVMNMTESSSLAMQLVPLKEACEYLQTLPSSFITVRPQQRAFFAATWILKKTRYCGSKMLGLELLVHGSHTPSARILIQVHQMEPHSRPSDVPFMYWVNHTCFCNRQMMCIEELPLLKVVLPVYRLVSSSAKRAQRARSGNGTTRSAVNGRGGYEEAQQRYGRQPLLPPPPSSTHVLGSSTVSPSVLSSASSSFVSASGVGMHGGDPRYSFQTGNPASSFSPLPFSMLTSCDGGGGGFEGNEEGESLLDTNASFVLSKAVREGLLENRKEGETGPWSSPNEAASKEGAAAEDGASLGSLPPVDPRFSHRRIFNYGPLLSIQQRTCRCAVTLGPIRGFPFLESASGQPHAFRIAITLLDKVGWKVVVGETRPSYPTASGSLQWNETLILQKWPGAVASQFCRLHLSEVRTTDGDETPIGAGLISLGDFNKIHARVPLCVALSVYETYSQYDQMISPSLLMKDITFSFFDVC